MGMFDKFKDFIGITNEEESDDLTYDPVVPDDSEERKTTKKDKNCMNINTRAQLQVILVKPSSFDEARDIADNLMAKRTVLLNIENLNKDLSRRVIDFLSGVAYAHGGNIKRVANRTYVITPYNVDILGDDVLDGLNPDELVFE